MTQATLVTATLRFLEDRWDPAVAATLDEPELLRYRSNLLGSDLRITNFAGGNTSSKVIEIGSAHRRAGRSALGQRLRRRPRQHQASGFCHALPGEAARARAQLQGRRHRRRHGGDVSHCAPSATTLSPRPSTRRCTAFFPSRTSIIFIPTGASPLAASANGKDKMDEFNREFNHSLVWIPWQRPGFELGLDDARMRFATIPAATASSLAATASLPGARRSASAT